MLDKWDVLDRDKFPECRFLRDDLEDLKICISDMEGMSRALFLFWSLFITLSRDRLDRSDAIYVLDGYWMKHAAGEIIYGCDAEWVTATAKRMPRPDVTIYLDVTPEVALRRKTSFTPLECGRRHDLSATAFVQHQTRLREQLLAWCEEFGWTKVSAVTDEEQVAAGIDAVLEGRLVPAGRPTPLDDVAASGEPIAR
ncbi:MAG: hypothetical protein QM820_34070 [Minicystis sp.]